MMDTFSSEILDCLAEGVVIVDERLEITFWNSFMTLLTGVGRGEAEGRRISELMPSFSEPKYDMIINSVLKSGFKMFLSAALHRHIIGGGRSVNIKLSRIDSGPKPAVLFEFIDITNETARINQLKDCTTQLKVLYRDLSEKDKAIKKLAYRDELTGLANRKSFLYMAEKLISEGKRSGRIVGFMFIDIDKFKYFNDNFGHAVGDMVLVQVAEILKETIRKSDMAVRYGGDEFIVVLNGMNNVKHCGDIAARIASSDKKYIMHNGRRIDINFSIGISFFPNDGETLSELINQADLAMYSAKHRKSGSCFSFVQK